MPKQPRRKENILDEIMRWKRKELAKQKRETPASVWRALAGTVPSPPDFVQALRPAGSPASVRLIAEIKRASPSRGLLCRDFDPEKLAVTYANNGAAAISCLTDARFFQGQLSHLVTGRKRLEEMGRPLPFLRKDFVFDAYQLAETRAAGAAAVLLITAVLGERKLAELIALAERLSLTPLVEVHNEAEVERALAAGAKVIGINNRDLQTFNVDLETTARLRRLIPENCLVVSESGIHTPDDVRRARDMGVDAVLVGEALVKAAPDKRSWLVKMLAKAGRAVDA